MNSLPPDRAMSGADGPVTLASLFQDIAGRLGASGVASPELDARLLICHACGLSHEQLAAHPGHLPAAHELAALDQLVRRRCEREPVSRILGTREFFGLEFALGPHTLDPRPDTESLVEAAIELAGERDGGGELAIADLGTGSGCVLISLLHELRQARGVGTDVSEDTLVVARANAERHGVASRTEFIATSWARDVEGEFGLVVSNPPYIPGVDIEALEPEVSRYDPRAALDGGADGLDAYRAILAGLSSLLAPGGWAVFETGAGQADDVSAMLRGAEIPFAAYRQWSDLSGRVRCVAGKRSPSRK